MSGGTGKGGARGRRRALLRSRAALWTAVGLVAAGLLAWWLVPTGGTPYPKGTVSISTGTPNGVYREYGELLKPYIEHDLPGVHVKLDTSEGSVENVRAVASGRSTFTVAAADAVADYSGPGRSRLRACARLYDDYVQLVVPNGGPVHTVTDLRGLRVGMGQRSSGVHLLSTRLLRAAGLDPAHDVRPITVGIDRAPKMLREGKLDAFFWSGGLPTPSIGDLAKEFPIRLVELGHLVDPLRRQQPKAGSYYRQSSMPSDVYPAAHPLHQPVSTIAVDNLLVTTDRVNAALVERLTRTVIRSRDRIGEQVHPAQLVDLRTAVYTAPLPLHEGARRYYRSVKP